MPQACDLLSDDQVPHDDKGMLADPALEDFDELVGMHKVGSLAEFNLDDLDGSFLDDAALGD